MQKWISPNSDRRRYSIVLFDRFSNHCFANTVEPLRAANGFLGRTAYDWQIVSPNGGPVRSSSGVQIVPDAALADAPGGTALILLPSYGHRAHITADLCRALRFQARNYDSAMGFDTGSWLLAEAGLLQGYAATIHYDELDRFAERFPEVEARRERWVEDRDRITAGGAMIAFELMCHLIGRHHGMAIATEVVALFMANPATGDAMRFHPAGDRRVARALALMSANVEHPLSIADIARHAGCSQRALQGRFSASLGTSPARAYQRLRLNAARQLVAETDMSIAEIATRIGYDDSSAFSRAFRAVFGATPRQIRG